jgi:predicted amidohydrolase
VEFDADLLVFPELSMTGYLPLLAEKLAMTPDDIRLTILQNISTNTGMIIALGLPEATAGGTRISMVLLHPQGGRQVYSKQHLHADEESFFVPGPPDRGFIRGTKAALAICYEISVPEHARRAHQNGAELYIASVVKTRRQVKAAHQTLARTAREYSMPVLMVNAVGEFDDETWGGKSAVWNSQGELLAQLDAREEGLLLFDTNTGETETMYFAEY